MEAMRDVLRGSLGRSLRGIGAVDRLAAAWTVACGCAMADHGHVVGYEAGVVRIEVGDPVWLRQMISLRTTLEREMARIAGLPVTAIEFVKEQVSRSASQRVSGLTSRRRGSGE
jgi:hypothetical protein